MSDTLSPAATVLLMCYKYKKLEVLLLTRNANASFLAEYWIFHGGASGADPVINGRHVLSIANS